MKVQAPFGIVTGCHAGDKFMVGATLASIRHYCPGVPVCLTVDGDFDVSDLERDYDVIILRVSELENQEMARFISGSFHAKHAAMWEGPFEFYVWLDSDAIVWGDLRPQVKQNLDFQILWDSISLPLDATELPDWIAHYYFDLAILRDIDPEFEWRGIPYFCAGVFACRRNVIPYEKYKEVEAWGKNDPALFAFGDMGMLNYLVHSMDQQGVINIGMTDLQNIPVYNGKSEFEEDCKDAGWSFPRHVSRPRIGHFCGRKPWIFDRKAYSKPFTIARLEHHRHSKSEMGAWLTVLKEDLLIGWRKVVSWLSRRKA